MKDTFYSVYVISNRNFLQGGIINYVDQIFVTYPRVGPIYEKFSDQALNWSKVVPWHEKQSEAIIFQLS